MGAHRDHERLRAARSLWPVATASRCVSTMLAAALVTLGCPFRLAIDLASCTGADFTAWCTQAGFRETRVIPLTPTASAAVAYK